MSGTRWAVLRAGASAAAVCATLGVCVGCGSSSSSTTTTTTKSSASEGLKPVTTPKYASPSSSQPVQSGTVQIAYRNIAIDPDTVRVKVGSTIKWTNFDPVEHNVVSKSGPDSFSFPTFGEGHSVEVKLTKPGVIHYQCTIHPTTMNGTIEVVK